MSNGAQNTNSTEQVMENVDTPMESAGKGKGKAAEEMVPADDSENSEEEGEEPEGEVEEPDEDNMEEIDMDNIMGSRTRGKNIDYAQAAKNIDEEEDYDEDEDEDFQEEDDKMED